jgi:hypothetical protein
MCQPLRRYTRILSAGFCSWGSGKGRPFPHVYHGDAPQNNIAEEQRYLFSIRFRYLAFAAIGFFGPS